MFKNYFFLLDLVDNLIHQERIVKFIDNKMLKLLILELIKENFKTYQKNKKYKKNLFLEPQKKVYKSF